MCYPSLGPLLKIARALGVRLGTLLDDQVSSDPLIIRQRERSQELSMLRSKNAPVALRFYSLGRKTDRHMEPFFVELLPESATEKHLSSHEGEEFIVVHSGHVEIVYGKEGSQAGGGGQHLLQLHRPPLCLVPWHGDRLDLCRALLSGLMSAGKDP